MPPFANSLLSILGTKASEDIFTYTSGRYVFNESLRKKERYVRFDIDAFKKLAAGHINHGKVADITKLAEGGFNRVFLLTMEDGFQAIAKMPYQTALPKYYATASEAATMELLRTMNIPVPNVLGYSASSDNPAGVEYIIMERAQGTQVKEQWDSMTKRQRHKLASSFVEIEKTLFSLPFSSIGSVYFKSDIPAELQAPLHDVPPLSQSGGQNIPDKFCIGPLADYMFWYGKRAGLDISRGPWNSSTAYLRSIADKEIEWTQQYGRTLELQFPHNGVLTGKQNPDRYVDLLRKYLALVPYLLPREGSELNTPTLRHPDLNPNNIFVDPETCEITCLIDWQHTTIEPRLLVAGYPRAFENPDTDEPLDLEEPTLPPEYDSLESDEKAEADELYRRMLMTHYYRIYTGVFNKPHLNALRDPLLNPRKHLVDRAGRQWSGNTITLKGALVRMVDYWDQLPETKGIECPVKFDIPDLDEFLKQEEMWLCFNAVVNHWRDELSISEDGWVSNENYEAAMKGVQRLKQDMLNKAEGDEEDIILINKGWPFDDHEEIS
ncbi:APH domain-containing protein [Trichophyton interdigitale]|uniref:APH domain-containing protein n=1 Tax=Trichophyton interdigitale TaxID=101480 RepID=A0A9P4YG72_9EURO|nr:APH domain-containing protein [Trichophyton interdigitale]KAF3898962.1 APH domain-containing protein [Trichophyton interdigitale]